MGLPVATLDLTLPKARAEVSAFGPEDVAVVGTPTYAGRVPNKFLPELQRVLRGQGTKALGIVTFGNRAYDSSLAELLEVLEADGFTPLGGAAMVCSHVFSDRIAPARPNAGDWALLDAWAEEAAALITGTSDGNGCHAAVRPLREARTPVAPYYTPLGVDGQPAKFLKAKPVTDTSRCVRCGMCVHVCPMGSIPAEDPTTTAGICIKCQACVKLCPRMARHFEDPAFLSHVQMLEKNYTRPADPAFFL
jgi:ferredoxin